MIENRGLFAGAIGFLIFLTAGCGTIRSRTIDSYDFAQIQDRKSVYGGIRELCNVPHPFASYDFFPSLIADTLLLPLTLVEDYVDDHSLHDAALAGDWATIALALNSGRSVESTDRHGHTLLMSAATGVQAEIIEELLKRGAQVNARSKHSQSTALAYALARVQIVRAIASIKHERSLWEKSLAAKKVISLLNSAGGKLYSTDRGQWEEAQTQESLIRTLNEFLDSGIAINPAK
ncbi:MAG: hypothetical protein GDA66_00525 [Nitrospira sp. CR1.2]|nr:hypothetical protein [Nitrospira sp. CR1.2]